MGVSSFCVAFGAWYSISLSKFKLFGYFVVYFLRGTSIKLMKWFDIRSKISVLFSNWFVNVKLAKWICSNFLLESPVLFEESVDFVFALLFSAEWMESFFCGAIWVVIELFWLRDWQLACNCGMFCCVVKLDLFKTMCFAARFFKSRFVTVNCLSYCLILGAIRFGSPEI